MAEKVDKDTKKRASFMKKTKAELVDIIFKIQERRDLLAKRMIDQEIPQYILDQKLNQMKYRTKKRYRKGNNGMDMFHLEAELIEAKADRDELTKEVEKLKGALVKTHMYYNPGWFGE